MLERLLKEHGKCIYIGGTSLLRVDSMFPVKDYGIWQRLGVYREVGAEKDGGDFFRYIERPTFSTWLRGERERARRLRLLDSGLSSEGSFLVRRDRVWNLGENQVGLVVRNMLERGYIKKAVRVENRNVGVRKISARDIVFRFEGLDVDREIRRVSREYRERYRVVGRLVGKYYFIVFRISKDDSFGSDRVFNSSY